MAINMKKGFQISVMPAPLIMMLLIKMIKCVAGIMLEISCNGNGKLSMGKMKPERSMVGIIRDTRLANMAACCVSTLVEMRIPSDNEATV